MDGAASSPAMLAQSEPSGMPELSRPADSHVRMDSDLSGRSANTA
jgi:hypothetical protein